MIVKVNSPYTGKDGDMVNSVTANIPNFNITNWISSAPDYKVNTPFGLDDISDNSGILDKQKSLNSLVKLLSDGIPDFSTLSSEDILSLDIDIRVGMDLFLKASMADSRDWLSIVSALGFPAHSLSFHIVEQLDFLRKALSVSNVTNFLQARSRLLDEAVVEMLENLVAVVFDRSTLQQEKGLAFIACSNYHRERLVIGAKSEDLFRIQSGLDKKHKLRRAKFGFLSLWLVHDVDLASKSIIETMASFRGLNSVYEVTLPEAKSLIQARLVSDDNLVLSPWHIDDDLAFKRIGI